MLHDLLFPNFLSLHTKPYSEFSPLPQPSFLATMNLTNLDVSRRWAHTSTVLSVRGYFTSWVKVFHGTLEDRF